MDGRRGRGRALGRSAAAALAVAAAALLAVACGGSPGGNQAGPPRPPPLPDEPLYSSGPDPGFYATAASLTASHQPKLAAGVLSIARTPTAFWAAGQPGEMQAVQGVMRGAASARRAGHRGLQHPGP